TVSLFHADGSLKRRAVTTTSADGLTVAKQVDLNGDGVFDGTRTTATVNNADGSVTTAQTDQSGNGTLIDRAVATTSADGRSTDTQTDLNGDGTIDITRNDVLVINPDGSRAETITDRSASGSLLLQSVRTTSADRKTITITQDGNGDGAIDRQETIVMQANGAVVDTVSHLNPNGSLLDRTVTTTSANGLSATTQFDANGDGVFDLTRTDVTVLNADGSRTRTMTETNANASVRDGMVTTVSATGLSSTVKTDLNGDGVFDLITVSNTVLNSDGSTTQTVQDKNANNTLRDQIVTTTGANGLSTTWQTDLNGDGTVDRVLTDVITLNADGSRTETVTETNGTGGLRAKTITTASADGRSLTVTHDSNGDGHLDDTRTIPPPTSRLVTSPHTPPSPPPPHHLPPP